MKMFAGFLLLALPGVAPPDDPRPTDARVEAAARGLVERLAAGEFDAAARLFAGPAPATVGPADLEAEWNGLVERDGPFGGIEGVRLERRPNGDYAYVRTRFGPRGYDYRVVIDARGRPAHHRVLPEPLGGPGLIRARMAFNAAAAEPGGAGRLTFPVPGTYREQVPLTFAVRAVPPEALRGFRLVPREDGRNWLCEAEVAPPEGGAYVTWEALVLVDDRPEAALPRADRPEAPAEAAPWLAPTGTVQADDPAIKAKADALAEGIDDVGTYAERVVAFAASNPIRMGLGATLDARCALETGSSCTGRANLAAALLRARGIPARTVAHLPTWSGPLFAHWLVEYWHPGAGWVWAEPSLNVMQPRPWTVAVLNVANPEDEDHPGSFAPTAERHVMAGATWLSVPELGPGLAPMMYQIPPGETSSIATPEARVEGDRAAVDGLFAEARRRFDSLTKRAESDDPARVDGLVEAAREGGATGLREALGGR